MGGDKSDRLALKGLIAHLDTPSETVGNTHVIYLRYAKAKDLVAVLTGVGKVKAQSSKKSKAAARRASNDFNIQADESSNTLVITAAPDIFRSLQAVVRKLDVRRAQVLVEAIIAEIAANKTNELGMQWFVDGSKSGIAPVGATSFGSPSLGDVGSGIIQYNATGTPPANASSLLGTGLTLGVGRFNSDVLNFGGLLRALAGTSAANLLSTPNIVTMDNEEAEIFVGREVSVPTGSFTQTSTSSSNPFTTFKPKQVGIRLKVKPQINEGDAIKLDIDQSVDAITAGDAGTANLVTSQRTIKTSVMVDDGQIIVLGGLIADDESNTVQKVPFLGDIPILGSLFRYKRNVKDKKNLMVFLHPTILRDSAVTSAISSSKYRIIREQQIRSRGKDTKAVTKELEPIMPRVENLTTPQPQPAAKDEDMSLETGIFSDAE
jgi:general secretion pathway protein D